MTRQSFYRTLKKVADQFEWTVESGTGWIRGQSKYDNRKCCPLTAVSLARTGIRVTLDSYIDAGNTIGVQEEDARKIAKAADNSDERYKRTREALLRAVGKI
jgi:hypothetical protein